MKGYAIYKSKPTSSISKENYIKIGMPVSMHNIRICIEDCCDQ